MTALTVGQVAERFGVTVRTLHHYDEIGLVAPRTRTARATGSTPTTTWPGCGTSSSTAGSGSRSRRSRRCSTTRTPTSRQHLRRQRAAVMTRLDEMRDLVAAIDRALEAEMNGMALTPEEQKELFGEGFSEEYAGRGGGAVGRHRRLAAVPGAHEPLHQGRLGRDRRRGRR